VPLLSLRIRTTSSKLTGLGEQKISPKISPVDRGTPRTWAVRTQTSTMAQCAGLRELVSSRSSGTEFLF
jgi:hypothetical protein